MRKLLIFSVLVAFVVLLPLCKKNCPMPSDDGDLTQFAYSPQSYSIVKPDCFPPVPIPADNPMTVAGVALGRRLFYDPILSADSTQGCFSCHDPKFSFTDHMPTSKGIDGLFGNRSSMSLLNVAYNTNGLFWDGRAATLEDQALQPVENPIELHAMWPNVVERLKKHATYPKFFREAFGISNKSEITKELAAKAIAQFERILISSGNSIYDRFQKDPFGTPEFGDDEVEGQDIFFNTTPAVPDGGCFHCHDGACLFTSNQYFNNGIEKNITDFNQFPDKGLGAIKGGVDSFGFFRAPTLRNIALSAPYMHDGRFKTLEEVVDHYGSGGNFSPGISKFIAQVGFPNGNGTYTGLTTSDKLKLVKFLKTLTDTTFVNNPDIQNPFK